MKEVLLILLGICFHISTPASNLFTNTWSIKTFEGEEVARNIAQRYGLSFLEKAMSFDDYYIFKLDTLESPTSVNMANLTKRLMESKQIMWAGQLRFKPVSYGPSGDRGGESGSKGRAVKKLHRSYRAPPPPRRDTGLGAQSSFASTGHFNRGPTINIGLFVRKTSAYGSHFTDPLWRYQWYAQDYRTAPGPVMDHDLVPVYRSLDSSGRPITGQGVTVAILDEGVDANHPDLQASLNRRLSYNFLMYSLGFSEGQPHGTMSAGVVAMAANNGVCGVGVAYGSKIAALKILGDADLGTDYTLGAGLGYSRNSIDIYSCSWGLRSFGNGLTILGNMERDAIKTGVSKGRHNKGSIYVFCAGNEKMVDISCAFQELGNLKEIILVGSATNQGKITSYSQKCPNVFVATYSSTRDEEGGVVSTLPGGCTVNFGGTSASVPIASGIIALVLQVNPRLGYRDIQHLITMSAEVAPLANNRNTWQKNKAGFWVSQDFGFGLMNAQNMVNLARNWINVKREVTCNGVFNFNPPRQFTSTKLYYLILSSDACENTNSAITFLERVTLTLNIDYPGRRGDLSISLASPRGSDPLVREVIMIQPRPNDNSRSGFNNWYVTSVQTWGENPKGDWLLIIRNIHNKNEPVAESSQSGRKRKDRTSTEGITGTITSLKLTFHGLASRPAHMANGPRIYSDFSLG